jgi:hypothetical protein
MTMALAQVSTPFRHETTPDWLTPTLHAICAVSGIPQPHLTRGRPFPPHAGAGADARAFTASTLGGWGRARLVDDAALTVTELFSNALRHGHGTWPDTESCRSIRLGLARLPAAVICLVSDPGSGTPVLKNPRSSDEGGRGLHVVDALATEWGYLPAQAHGPGKTVWALFAAPGSGAC